jgi:hypothetical protein
LVIGRAVTNVLLLGLSIAAALAMAEASFRVIDGYRLGQLSLGVVPRSLSGQPTELSLPDARRETFAGGFDVSWYTADPPQYDRSSKFSPPADWAAAVKNYRQAIGRQDYTEIEFKFLYNDKWLEEACAKRDATPTLRQFRRYPGFVYSFASPDGSTKPEYRMVPRGWDSEITYFNNFGFRGPDIEPRKPDRVIRVAFLGASALSNGWPYTSSEYAVSFLRLWAQAQHLDVDFDLINASRGGIDSTASAQIMRYEVAPLRPDIVVYYQGARTIASAEVKAIVRDVDGKPFTARDAAERRLSTVPENLPLEQYSALARRIYELVNRRTAGIAEPTKPPHKLSFDLKQTDPDLDAKDLPFGLTRQIADVVDIEGITKSIGAQFAVASSIALAQDGLRLDPDRDRLILSALNVDLAPLTYAEIRDAVDFENAVYRKLAKRENFAFLHLDSHFPQDPSYFWDMVHQYGNAFRLEGWVMAQLLAPYILKAVSEGSLPRPGRTPDPKSIEWASAPTKRFNLGCLPD